MESQKGMNDINKNLTEEDEVDFIDLESEEPEDDRIFKDIDEVLEEDEVEEEKIDIKSFFIPPPISNNYLTFQN